MPSCYNESVIHTFLIPVAALPNRMIRIGRSFRVTRFWSRVL